MRRFDPDVVITHSPVDYMLDHEEASRLARGATFALAMPNYETRQNPPRHMAGPLRRFITRIPWRGMIRWDSASFRSSMLISANPYAKTGDAFAPRFAAGMASLPSRH